MANLDFVKIEKYFCIYDKFHQCILDLLISHRTHYRDYYQIITELQDYVDSTKSWSLETKNIKYYLLQNIKIIKKRIMVMVLIKHLTFIKSLRNVPRDFSFNLISLAIHQVL